MEFPAGAVTNLRMTELYSTVHWRIYCISHQIHSPGTEVLDALGSALTSELDSSILALRDHGCLVDTAPGEEGIWVFSHNGEFSNLQPFSTVENDHSLSALQVGTTTIKLIYADITPLGYLIKRLMTDSQSTIFSPLTQKNLVTAKADSPISWEAVTASAFYRAFTSAIAGLLSLRATQMHGAIPLGKRTLFTMADSDEEPIQSSLSDSPSGPTALLSTLNIELSFKTLLISWRTIPQHGLQQLLSEPDSEITSNISLLEDIWLAPTGSLCRYIGPEPFQPDESQRHLSSGDQNEFDFLGEGSPVRRREWKQAAYQWLQKFGLGSEASETEAWVEVEALNETRNPMVITKFLWPARLCFRRSNGFSRYATPGIEHFDPATMNPLEFAESWFRDYETTRSSEQPRLVSGLKEAEGLQPDILTAAEKTTQSDALLSLARNINFPELSASAVYPTPPGGVTGAAFASVPASDGLVISSAPGLSQSHVQSEVGFSNINLSNSAYRPAPASLTGIDTTTPALGIGSGMYDTTADDDLFDELDGSLETKQVTEADFNFFDQPDSSNFPGLMDTLQDNADDFEITRKSSEEKKLNTFQLATGTVEPATGSTIGQGASHASNNTHPPMVSQASKPEEFSNLHIPSHSTKPSFQESITPPPPLSPLKIKDFLFSDGLGLSGTAAGISPGDQLVKQRNKSDYEPVSFKRNLGLSDKKYQMDGPFWFLPDAQDPKTSDKTRAYASDIPTIGIPDWPAKERRRLDNGSGPDHSTGSSPESSTETSEDGNESDTAPPDRLNPGLCVGLTTRDNSQFFKEFSLSPLERSTVNTEVSIAGVDLTMLAFLRSLLFQSTEWSLDGYFPLTGNRFPVLTRNDELIQVVQLAVDQVTQTSLPHSFSRLSAGQSDCPNTLPLSFSNNDSWYGEFASFDLKRYTSIDDDNPATSLRKDFRYVLVGSISKLDPPNIQIHRGKGYLEILPPAIPFWKPFGLEPIHGQKDIISFCVHPKSAQESADAFLDRLGLLYSSANLGRHSRPSGSTGLVSWEFDPRSGRDYATIMNGLQSTCEHLGDIMSTIPPGKQTMVVYIANPFRDETAIIDICTAFLGLFRRYVSNVDKHAARPNEVALQIIPLDFIASITSLVVPSQREFLNLAFEVYSRCPPKQNSSELLGCAPPFTLARSAPKFVPFKLAPEPGSPLAERNFLHVAYSQSYDRRWITAAWTDNIGKEQATLTYCLREKGSNTSRPLSEIRADIWDVTLHIVGKSHSYWRVLLVKDEPVELDEAEAWVSLAQQHNQTKPTKIELTLLSVNTRPCVYFRLPSSPLQVSSLTGPNTSTPVTTPNPGMPSPDPSATAPTPPPSSAEQAQTPGAQFLDSTDSDTVLVDKSDETWSVTLSHRLNISPSMTSYHPALASGYLVRRRRGISDTDGLASLGLNLLFTHARVPTEMLLKDVLRMYRDLTTLARTRGMIHAQGDAPLPWHISTAVKGREFLSCVI